MKFSFVPNPFNIEILGKKSGRLVYAGRVTESAVRGALAGAQRGGYRFLDVVPREEERWTVEAMIRGGFDLVGILVEFSRRLDKGVIARPHAACRLIRAGDRRAVVKTGVEFTDDRYSQDPRIGRKAACRLFKRWIENSIDGRSDFIYVHQGAFCACFIRKDDGVGVIDLIGVPRNLQGRGIGISLVLASLAEFKKRGCKRTIVKTAGTNAAAMRSYAICGYDPSILYYALHWHG